MRKLRFMLSGLATLLFAVCVFAQSYEKVENDNMGVRIYTLNNGLKVYMSVNKDVPRIQTYIAVRVGSKNDPKETTGLAHYFEHMMFKGTESFGTSNWQEEKKYIDRIEELYEVYRKETDFARRTALYKQIDSLSYIASGFAIANEYDKMMSFIGSEGTNAATSNDFTYYQENIPSNQLENWAKIQADRFANPVLRLFHTELETIYEEKNMSLTNDRRKANEAMLKALFPHHPYGQQTTLGEAEHLRNPSLKNIKAFHSQYYVPNNYCIAMSGDFNPDEAIKIIDKYFGKLKSKPVPEFKFEYEPEQTTVKEVEVKGLEAAYITIAYRINAGSTSREAMLAELTDQVLHNGSTGLIDKNINQKRLVARANSGVYGLNDYTAFMLQAFPKSNQSLDDLKTILLRQIEVLKSGNWDENILKAAINNLRFREIKSMESNSARAMKMAQSYLSNESWENVVNSLDMMSKVSKEEIVAFANKVFKDNNYVVVKKVQGEPAAVEKVEKPPITPIQINRDAESAFFKQIKARKVSPIQAEFTDYSKAMSIEKTDKGTEVLYVKNKDNSRYSLTFRYAVGTWENKYLQLLGYYQKYLHTPFLTQEQVQEKLFNLATFFRISSNGEETLVTMEGLTDNMLEALEVVDDLLTNPVLDTAVVEDIKNQIKKDRQDAKSKQASCFSALASYALYGEKTAHRTLLSDKEIDKISADVLCNQIKDLKSYKEQIRYYGDLSEEALLSCLKQNHKMADKFTKEAKAKPSEKQSTKKNEVFFVDYPAKQSYCRMFIVGDKYNESERAVAAMYNEYFGGSMNSIVFQEMREKRSLAYQAMSRYITGSDKNDRNYNLAHIATQNDKVIEAFDAFNSLLDSMPLAQANFDLAKQSLLSSMRTQRISKQNIISSFLNDRRFERANNSLQQLYTSLQGINLEQIQQFSKEKFQKRGRVYVILGSKEQIDMKALKKFGKVKELTLEDIFGY